jgi:hypothetical protein
MFQPLNRSIIRLYMDWRRLMDQVVSGGGGRDLVYIDEISYFVFFIQYRYTLTLYYNSIQ